MFSNWGKRVIIIKATISIGLLIYLIWLIDWERAIRIMRDADLSFLFVVPFFTLCGLCIASIRWIRVLNDTHVRISFKEALYGYLLGAFYSIFLPGVIGGDAIRIGVCKQKAKCPLSAAISSVLVERSLGVLALLCFILFSCLIFPASFSTLTFFKQNPFLRFSAVPIIVLFISVVLGSRVILKWIPKSGGQGISVFFSSGVSAIAGLKWKTLGIAFCLSALFQSTDILGTFLLSKSIGINVSVIVLYGIVPVVYLITVLPISLGGIGVREGAFVVILSQFGVMTSDAVTLSFLVYLNRLLIGGVGWGVHSFESLSKRKKSRELGTLPTVI